MRVASKINLAILTTFVFALILIMGNLFILSEQFKALDRTEKANSITRLSNSLLVLTQEFVLFKSPSVAESWNGARAELETVLADNLNLHDRPQELLDIQSSLAELTPIFSELSTSELARNIDPEFQARRESLIVERLIAETQVISELGYKWSSQANEVQKTSLRSLTLLGALGLLSFVLVIVLLVVMMRSGILVPLSKLKRTADAIRSGYEDTVCDIDTSDELGDVARAVNQMAHNLAHKNKRLREANARVELASQAKTEFLSRMSHELRTPLNAMLGFAQLLRVDPQQPLSSTQRQKVDHIERAGAHLLAMLTDVLDLSRIEAGSLPMQLQALPVTQALDEAAALVGHQARDAGLSLRVTPANPQWQVVADQVRLRQVLVNLLSNGIKYNRPGGWVQVEAQAIGQELALLVTDTGAGLDAQQQAHLFEPFNRLGAERSGVEGTGIGLVIVQRLVALMKGRVEVSSTPGVGSTFRVWLPLAAMPTPRSDDAPRTTRSGFGQLDEFGERTLHVLYAEDNPVNVELVRQVMRMRPQWNLAVAINGQEAITRALSQPPDLLLLDMHLGDMTGLDVSDALAAQPATADIPRVALSADVMPDRVDAARRRGFVDYLSKPLDVTRLLKLLDRCARGELIPPG